MAKRYYWLKLKENFFNAKEIKKLRNIAGGDTYTVIYLKLMLLSLQDEGKLFFDGIEDTFAEELALELDEDPENVKVTLMYLQKVGLLEEASDTEAFLTQVPESVGKETDKAAMMRRLRARGNNVTTELPTVTKCYTEIEIDKDKDKDINILPGKPDYAGARIEVITYLNQQTGKDFRHSSKANVRLVEARLNEGYSVEDFKKVIDNKVAEWKGTEQEQYLRPETLFAPSHFESYLNQRRVRKKGTGLSEAMTHNYDMDDLRKRAKE